MKNLLIVLCILPVIFGISCSNTPQTESTGNTVLENILSRKSVRDFIGKKVENEKITILLKAGMAAPSRERSSALGTDRNTKPFYSRFNGCGVALCKNAE